MLVAQSTELPKLAATNTGLPAGLAFPDSGTVYVLEVDKQQPALVQLHATEIHLNSQAAGNFARGMVYAGAHASVEIEGAAASTTVHGGGNAFYVHVEGQDADLLSSRVHLIRLQKDKNRRVVATFSQNVFGGQRKKRYDDVAISKVEAEPNKWLKITPISPLQPGEYGIAFMPSDANLLPDDVYDFTLATRE